MLPRQPKPLACSSAASWSGINQPGPGPGLGMWALSELVVLLYCPVLSSGQFPEIESGLYSAYFTGFYFGCEFVRHGFSCSGDCGRVILHS